MRTLLSGGRKRADTRPKSCSVDADGLGEDDDAPDKTELEARFAAKRIRALLDEGFPVTDKADRKAASGHAG